MFRRLLAVVVALALFVGTLLAAEGTVVSFDKKKGTLVVKVEGKERKYQVDKKTHVHDLKGKEVKYANFAKHLKKGVRVEVEDKDGKVIEINIKAKKTKKE
jgi:hypothetical protein